MTYPQRVRDTILPLSVAGNLPEAFEEWSFTETIFDHEAPIETCELCGKKEVRYHFQIENALTEQRLWVGSHCILQFGVSVFEDDEKLTPAQAKKKLARLKDQMRLEFCLSALQRLAAAENNNILKGALGYYELNKCLTPKYGAVVLWRLKANKIDHSPTFFKITLKRSQHKEDLRNMKRSAFLNIWPALSASQRKLAASFGHFPPC